MKVLSLGILIALSQTLCGQTYVEQLPYELQSFRLMPYLLEGQDLEEVSQNIAKYIQTVIPPDEIGVLQLDHLARLITAKFGFINNSEAERKAATGIMLGFYQAGIPAAASWLGASGFFKDLLLKIQSLPGLSPLALRLLKYKPDLAADPYLLHTIMASGSPSLIRYVVNRDDLRPILTRKADGLKNVPLAYVFPIKDPEIDLILREAFDNRTLDKARSSVNIWYSSEVVKTLLKNAFNKPEDFLRVLSLIYPKPHFFDTDPTYNLLNLRNDQGETVLMKLIEYRDKYTDSEDSLDATKARSLVDYLIKNTDINATDLRGKTALIKATQKRDFEAVGLLLGLGADPFHTDIYGISALNYARTEAIKQLFADKLGKRELV